MTDLFANTQPRIGHSNAMFLADLTAGASFAELRANLDAGKYPEIHRPSVRGWMVLAGRMIDG